MRAAIFRNGEIVVDTLPGPKPGPGQVLVKTLACGICGSDLHARNHCDELAAVRLSLYHHVCYAVPGGGDVPHGNAVDPPHCQGAAVPWR